VRYLCEAEIRLDRSQTTISIQKTFLDDGSVLHISVEWRDGRGQAVQGLPPGHQARVGLSWSLFQADPSRIDWTNAQVRIEVNGVARSERDQPRRGELWWQFLIDRNRTFRLLEQPDGLYLDPRFGMFFASELVPLTTSAGMSSPLESLLALSSGGARTTVYETHVTATRQQRGLGTVDPVLKRRVIVAYDVDVAALARMVGEIRGAVETWEAGLGDFRAACRRYVEEAEENIVVTPR
jgi:hypothetical protein